MRSGADLRGGSPLVSFNHVTDPHFVTSSSSLYTTIRNPNPNNNRKKVCNPILIADRQTGPRDLQNVIILARSAFCHVSVDSSPQNVKWRGH